MGGARKSSNTSVAIGVLMLVMVIILFFMYGLPTMGAGTEVTNAESATIKTPVADAAAPKSSQNRIPTMTAY